MSYLPDATNFQDLEKKEHPEKRFSSMANNGPWQECHVCKGYGYWNLKLNQYKKPGTDKMAHFQCCCSQCNGWGWVRSGTPDATCERHRFARTKNVGRCLNEYTCENCNHVITVDSSD